MGKSINANFKEPHIKPSILEGRNFLKDYVLMEVLVFIIILFAVLNPQFMGINNIFAILRAASITALLALGLNIIVIVGGFDISIAAVANFVAAVSIAYLMNDYTNVPVIWVTSILVGTAISFITSLFVIYVKIPSFIATLGMMVLATGLSRPLTRGGQPTYPKSLPPGFTVLGKYDIAGLVPVSVIIAIVVAAVVLIVVEYTSFGRKLYAVGGNPDASKHVGIKINKITMSAFLISGTLYGIAGIITSSMFGSSSVDSTSGYLMPAIISVFLGTAFLSRGHTNIRGTLISVLILSVLVNGFVMINLPFFLRNIIQGMILIFAIGIIGSRKVKKILKIEDIKNEEST